MVEHFPFLHRQQVGPVVAFHTAKEFKLPLFLPPTSLTNPQPIGSLYAIRDPLILFVPFRALQLLVEFFFVKATANLNAPDNNICLQRMQLLISSCPSAFPRSHQSPFHYFASFCKWFRERAETNRIIFPCKVMWFSFSSRACPTFYQA